MDYRSCYDPHAISAGLVGWLVRRDWVIDLGWFGQQQGARRYEEDYACLGC